MKPSLTHQTNAEGFPVAQSFSHAWSAAPLSFFVGDICGIRADSPGWRSIVVRPDLCDLKHAGVSVLTPLGEIRSAWSRDETGIKGTLDLPDGISGRYINADEESIALHPGRNDLPAVFPSGVL